MSTDFLSFRGLDACSDSPSEKSILGSLSKGTLLMLLLASDCLSSFLISSIDSLSRSGLSEESCEALITLFDYDLLLEAFKSDFDNLGWFCWNRSLMACD